MAYVPTAPNRLGFVQQVAAEMPAAFKNAARSDEFIRILAKRLHFGSDARFGLNGKRGTDEVSRDAVSFIAPGSPAGGVEIIDVIVGSKGPNPEPQWSDATQATVDAGTIGKWIDPVADRPTPPPPAPPMPPPPPPPIPGTGDGPLAASRALVLTPGQGDYPAFLDHAVFIEAAAVEQFNRSKRGSRRFSTGDWGHFLFRMSGHEILRWAREDPGGDLERHGMTGPLTVGKLLDMTWPIDVAVPSLPPALSLLELAEPQRGNFLHAAEFYFPPHVWVASEAELRRWLQWNKDQGYTFVLAMMEQTHWGIAEGRDPKWTKPEIGVTPLVYTGHQFPVYGWTNNLDELIRRITIARAEYGLGVVCSLWEQERIEFDLETAIRETPRVVAALDPHVIAFRNSWEINEVLDTDDQHLLNNLIGDVATKPSGPHFASFMPSDDYWQHSYRAALLWHQYDNSLDATGLAQETRKVINRTQGSVVVIADEHSPAVRHTPSYTHAQSQARAQACLDAGAFASNNG